MLFTLLAAAALSTVPPRDVLPTADAPVPAVPVAARAHAKPVRYCFRHVEEGPFARNMTCKTRNQWMWQGVDPLDYLGRKK